MNIKMLDNINKKIIELLSQNARMSYVEIGKQVNLSRVAVKTRIEQLEKDGVIEKYSIIVNPEKLGKSISVYLDIDAEPKYLYEIASSLSRSDSITDIYHMTGSCNLHVHALLKNKEALNQFLQDEVYVLTGINRVECKMIISRLKTRKGIRI